MLDINLVRANPALVRDSLKKRSDGVKMQRFEEFLEADVSWRKALQETEQLKRKRNDLTAAINKAKKEEKPVDKLIKEAKQLPEKIKKKEAQTRKLRELASQLLMCIPNVLHESVPFGASDADNVVVESWGKIKKKGFEVKHHGQLAAELGAADFERAVKISGTGFFYLKGGLALLDLALQRYAIDLLLKKGFTLVQVPHLMRREPYEGVVSLGDFETVMYKAENDGLYLIATAEHPLAAMHMNEILEEEQLPIKLAGVSPCYRREIGKHGLDERGFFRVHQFNKVEQFVFCKPEESYGLFEEIARNAELVLEGLDIPYQRVLVCTGDIGEIAAKKYDINGWSPREKKHIELMSCSNCTDYQANRLKIRYRKAGAQEKQAVHTLNNTMVATTRTLRCIIENYQTKQGTITVPKVLRPYMNGLKEIAKK